MPHKHIEVQFECICMFLLLCCFISRPPPRIVFILEHILNNHTLPSTRELRKIMGSNGTRDISWQCEFKRPLSWLSIVQWSAIQRATRVPAWRSYRRGGFSLRVSSLRVLFASSRQPPSVARSPSFASVSDPPRVWQSFPASGLSPRPSPPGWSTNNNNIIINIIDDEDEMMMMVVVMMMMMLIMMMVMMMIMTILVMIVMMMMVMMIMVMWWWWWWWRWW